MKKRKISVGGRELTDEEINELLELVRTKYREHRAYEELLKLKEKRNAIH